MTSKPDKGTLAVILGPTGSGKTDLSIELASRLSAPVVSFDSRQVFRGMAIGTAQPSPEQLNAARHYFIADREIADEYNSGIFAKEALALLGELFRENAYVVAVGGSGLYIDALLYGFDDLPVADVALRQQLEERIAKEGLESLVEKLSRLDPEYYAVVDKNNPARVLRALEVCLTSGRSYSSQRSGSRITRDFNVVKIGIDMPREELYDRINRRVDIMIAQGLEAEARALYPYRALNSLNTVGYRELFDYFDGGATFEEAVELIKRNSRRYAKRQLTWFRRDAETQWFSRKNIDAIENLVKKFAE